MRKEEKGKVIQRKFFEKNTLDVAKQLLGCFLVRKIGTKTIKAKITEVEAYIGEDDLACHASRGRTKRTEIMYGQAGHAYVYLIYGMYELLNIVTERKDFPAAILIRAVAVDGVPKNKTNGPGKLCRFLHIDRRLNGWDVTKGEKLWIDCPSPRLRNSKKITATKRIGVEYAGNCKNYPWRFLLKD